MGRSTMPLIGSLRLIERSTGALLLDRYERHIFAYGTLVGLHLAMRYLERISAIIS